MKNKPVRALTALAMSLQLILPAAVYARSEEAGVSAREDPSSPPDSTDTALVKEFDENTVFIMNPEDPDSSSKLFIQQPETGVSKNKDDTTQPDQGSEDSQLPNSGEKPAEEPEDKPEEEKIKWPHTGWLFTDSQ